MVYLLFPSLGIFSVSYFPQLPAPWLIAVIFFCACLFLFFRYYAFALLLIGLAYGCLYGYWIIYSQLPQSLSGETFWVEGVVVGIPTVKQGKQGQLIDQFSLRVKAISPEGNSEAVALTQRMRGQRVTLSWYGKPRNQRKINTGDAWRLRVKLKRPRGFVNPGGFDYQLHLLQKQIMATGYIKKSQHNQWLERGCDGFLKPGLMDCWRSKLYDHFTGLYRGQPMLGPLLGLLIGERGTITQAQWDTVKATGTVHLFAISGLHVGLAALVGLLLGQSLIRLYQWIFGVYLHWLPSLLSIVSAGVYSGLAGLSLPTQRALIAIIFFHLLVVLQRKVGSWLFVSVALLGIALLDPLSIRSQGFWLSFAAVVVLLWSFSGYINAPAVSPVRTALRWLGTLARSQWVMTIGLFFPSLVLLQGVSVLSPVANFFAVPVVSFITVPLLLISLFLLPFLPLLSQLAADLALQSLEWLFALLSRLQDTLLPKGMAGFWYFAGGELSWWTKAVAMVGVIGLLSPRGIPIKGISLVCCLPLVLPFFFPGLLPAEHRDPLQITFLDVGQGTAVVIETEGSQLVYDTGLRFSDRFDTGKHIIAPYLMQRGYQRLDRLVISHGDSDHAGGLAGLGSMIVIDHLLSGEPAKTQGLQCVAGQQWQWDQVVFQVLWPTAAYLKTHRVDGNSNNISCVLLLRYGNHRVLLAGDIEKTVEKQLLTSADLPTGVDILLVPHHGSRTSSHLAWVKQVQPDYAVVTAGYRNAYGHPHPVVKARYQQLGARVLNTGEEGAIRFALEAQDKPWIVERWRQSSRRYWYDDEPDINSWRVYRH